MFINNEIIKVGSSINDFTGCEYEHYYLFSCGLFPYIKNKYLSYSSNIFINGFILFVYGVEYWTGEPHD